MPKPNPKQILRSKLANQFIPNLPAIPMSKDIMDLTPIQQHNIELYGTPNKPTNFAEQLINPIDPETGLPNVDIAGPVMVGPTGQRNAKKIFDEIKGLNIKNPTQIAIEFVKRKYPKLTSAIKGWGIENPSSVAGGFFDPHNNYAYIHKPSNRKKIKLNDLVQYATHETMHGVQNVFQNRKKELLSPEEGGIYKGVTADPFLQPKKYKEELNEYLNQPVEVEARQAGSTGEEAFNKFSNLMENIPEEKSFNIYQSFNRNNIDDILKEIFQRQHGSKAEDYIKFAERHMDDPSWRFEDLVPITDSILHDVLRKRGYTSVLRENSLIPGKRSLYPSINRLFGIE